MQPTMPRPYLINMACTGVIPTKALNPHVPINHQEIVDEVGMALELGVQMVHLHARDSQGQQTGDPEPYGRMIESIRQLPGGRDLVVCVTTSGRKQPDFAARSRVLRLTGSMKPDMASLTLSSLNFMQSASINEPEVIFELAACMQEQGILPELEVFDLGMANVLHQLQARGLVGATPYINILLGNVATAQADLLQAAVILASLPAQGIRCVAGLGRFQLQSNVLGLLYADGVRTGLEDNIWLDANRSQPATNRTLIERVMRIATEMERPLMSRSALREKLFG